MRTYFTFNNFEPRFPEQFRTLKAELNRLGTVNCTDKALEDMYEEFSEERFASSWIDVESRVYDDYKSGTSVITHFAIWLSEKIMDCID